MAPLSQGSFSHSFLSVYLFSVRNQKNIYILLNKPTETAVSVSLEPGRALASEAPRQVDAGGVLAAGLSLRTLVPVIAREPVTQVPVLALARVRALGVGAVCRA